MTENRRKRTQRHKSKGVEIQLWSLGRRSPGCLHCHYDKWIQPSVRGRSRVMRGVSANNPLQTCRWRICRSELSSTLTGADCGGARQWGERGGEQRDVAARAAPRIEANVTDCFGEHLTPGRPRGSCLITHLHSESCFSFLLPPPPPLSSPPLSLVPGSLIPGAWMRWCIPGGAPERGGQQWGARRSALNPQLQALLSGGGGGVERVMGRDADSVSD